MTRKEVVFQFFRKSVIPVAGAALLVCIFKSACIKTALLTICGSGCSAGCPLASIGCGAGLYRATVPWVEGLPYSR